MIRSMLFVPCDSARKLEKAPNLNADAVVLDLEDSVLPDRKSLARKMMAEFLAKIQDRHRYWVRVNDITSGELLKDLAAVVPAHPQGIVLPKIRGPEDLETVIAYLDALEVAAGIEPDSIQITAVITETPSAVLRMGDLVKQPRRRLKAVIWGGEDLSSAMGAGDPRAADGSWHPTYEYARSIALMAAHALGVEAIDTVYVDTRNPEGLRHSCQRARYDGFTGRVAIHPAQLDIINEAFTPTTEQIAAAERIVEEFKSGAGAVSIDGKMYDIPHLKAAKRLLGQL